MAGLIEPEVGIIFTSKYDRPAHDFEYTVYFIGVHPHVDPTSKPLIYYSWINTKGEKETNCCYPFQWIDFIKNDLWTVKSK
jgi:hypothetical protein